MYGDITTGVNGQRTAGRPNGRPENTIVGGCIKVLFAINSNSLQQALEVINR